MINVRAYRCVTEPQRCVITIILPNEAGLNSHWPELITGEAIGSQGAQALGVRMRCCEPRSSRVYNSHRSWRFLRKARTEGGQRSREGEGNAYVHVHTYSLQTCIIDVAAAISCICKWLHCSHSSKAKTAIPYVPSTLT